MKRRQLLKRGALAGAAAALPAGIAIAGIHQPVASALGAYSKQVAAKSSGDGSVHLVASIDNMEAFTDHDVRLKALPYTHIRAEGNLLTFTHEGVDYTIENVLPPNFAKALG